MPKINFYLLSQDDEVARRQFACRLADKLLRQGIAVQLYISREEEAIQLDQLLWSFTPESFVPHYLMGTEPVAEPGVLVSWGSPPAAPATLLNLSDSLPEAPERFAAIAEFVLQDAASRDHGRELWNLYKTRGFELQHHQM